MKFFAVKSPEQLISEVGQPPPLSANGGDATSIAIALARENGSLGVVMLFLLISGWFLDFKGIFKDIREGFHAIAKMNGDIELLNSQVKARYQLIEDKQQEINQKIKSVEQVQQDILLKIVVIVNAIKKNET